MALFFPALRPTTRTYEAPEFALKLPEYVGAIAYPRLLGSKPGKARLKMSFENILDADAALIIAAYMNTLSGFLPITLPVEVVAGITETNLANRIQSGEHLDWYFESFPRQSSVQLGVSTVQVELIGDF